MPMTKMLLSLRLTALFRPCTIKAMVPEKNYIKDPSNQNKDFKRIRIRRLLRDLEIEGLDKKKLQLTINNLKDSYTSVIFYTNKNIKENSVYSLKHNKFQDIGHEYITRVVLLSFFTHI